MWIDRPRKVQRNAQIENIDNIPQGFFDPASPPPSTWPEDTNTHIISDQCQTPTWPDALDIVNVEDSKHDTIDFIIPEHPDMGSIQQARELSAPEIGIEVASKWSPAPDFKPKDLSLVIHHVDRLGSLELPPIPPEVLVERADIDTTKDEDDPNNFDLRIHVPKPTLQDSIHDVDFDYEPPPPSNLQPLDPIGPSTPAIDLNIEPFDAAPHSITEDFDQKTIKQPDIELCLAPWATSKPAHDSTATPETELFPAEAPRTFRDMLQWLAGLKNQKHHGTLRQCVVKAFGVPHSDPSQLAIFINHAKITPTDLFDILQLTAMFAGSVLFAIAPNWKANVSSSTVKPKSSDQSEEPDCCALLCQLRDYAYACHYQLQFLKSQCNRDKLSGGWQDCHYGSDITSPNSPLQAFLTDGWDSTFKTHPFDPCNFCLKSRIRMGFRDGDLPSSQQTGATLSTILTPSCGGDDPLLTLCSYLNCLTRRTPRTTGELVSFFHHFGIELNGYASESLSSLGNSLSTPYVNCVHLAV
ncbi:hypothetical protein BBBOND_0308850 [Babesia bigemina]|uniref:Uncharacterized protein n=1 Tax=Babesia bigemina TaxID=5866 RepID=A0A061DAH7_BABBI|nr:hypothetical protein BBBOND_0308850 [Babesia bigemina]CDR96982.1 hypothetical protein BBBOND_0308850 [Babesia bigemina]|eukprot:XP_012769168.1 hypothetical protein BBBOND_0308850 [Babesia bigemina]